MSECVILEEGFCACHGPEVVQLNTNGTVFNSLRHNGISFQNVEFLGGEGNVIASIDFLAMLDTSDNTASHVALTPVIMREIGALLIARANHLEPKAGLN